MGLWRFEFNVKIQEVIKVNFFQKKQKYFKNYRSRRIKGLEELPGPFSCVDPSDLKNILKFCGFRAGLNFEF